MIINPYINSDYIPYKHQQATIDFLAKVPEACIASSPGTGKSMSILYDIVRRKNAKPNSKTLIIAPKSLLTPVWQGDIAKFTPALTSIVAMAPAKKRKEAFEQSVDVYITNTDAVKWLALQIKNDKSFFDDFETIVVDESIFFINDSQRTRALIQIRPHFKYARILNGTLTGGPLSNLYWQYFFLSGRRDVGPSYAKFRNKTMMGYAKPNGPPQFLEWKNKPGMEVTVAHMLKHMTIRHDLTDVIDMPSRIEYTYTYDPILKVMKAYKEMKNYARTQLENQDIPMTAINASALNQSLQQIAAGSIKDKVTGKPVLVDSQRFDIVVELIQQYQKQKPIVFFNYKTQRVYMMKFAEDSGLKCAFIDGSVSGPNRAKIVSQFQRGKLDCLFLNPLAASHGLTLTASSVSIWSVPIYRGDIFIQAQHRNFRIGQDKRVISIFIEANRTIEKKIYTKLKNKVTSINLLSDAVKE